MPSPSYMPSPSDTPSPSDMPSPSDTPSPSDIPSPNGIPSPSDMPSPSDTPSPCYIPSPSDTPSPSDISSPSDMPSPSDMSSPSDIRVQATRLLCVVPRRGCFSLTPRWTGTAPAGTGLRGVRHTQRQLGRRPCISPLTPMAGSGCGSTAAWSPTKLCCTRLSPHEGIRSLRARQPSWG